MDDRRARYVCELVAVGPHGEEERGTGTLEGTVAHEPRGSEGFGYDPIFVPEGETRTVAELGNSWKARNSHRARAARARRGVRAQVTTWHLAQASPAASGSSSTGSRLCFRHQFSSAPNTSTFDITYSHTSRITGEPNVFITGFSSV